MAKVRDLVTSTEKLVSSTRRSSRSSFAGFRRADEEEKRLVKEERHQKELTKIAQEASLLRAVEDEQKRVEIEQNQIIRTNFINNKISNAFGTKTKIDSSPIRQSVIDNILPKALVPEQVYSEPFEEEPLLNKELADFKKKVYEHLRKMGFTAGGGGIGYIADAGDVDSGTAKVDGRFLKYQSSTGKWIGSSTTAGGEAAFTAESAPTITPTATGIDAVAIGDGAVAGNSASDYGSLAFGARSSALGVAATAIGEYATSSGANSVAIGGSSSDATSADATGIKSVAIGYNSSASADRSVAIGDTSNASDAGQFAFATGSFAADGDAQTSVYVLRNTTTTSTQTELYTNGSSSDISVASDSTVFFRVSVSARRVDVDNESAAYIIEGCIDNNAGTTALVGGLGSKTIIAEDTSTWDAIVTADNTNDGINILVTGEASKTIRWVARVETTVVGG